MKKEKNLSKDNEEWVKKIHQRANSTAKKIAPKYVDKMSMALGVCSDFKWDTNKVDRVIGEAIALSYALGFRDSEESKL